MKEDKVMLIVLYFVGAILEFIKLVYASCVTTMFGRCNIFTTIAFWLITIVLWPLEFLVSTIKYISMKH